jgi:uncharacterized protein
MKKYIPIIFSLVILPIIAFAYTSPGKPQGFVSDYAKVISSTAVSSIENQLQSLKNLTGVEVAVVTIPSLQNETIETYAEKLFREWGIGTKGKDNGLLILVAPNDRMVKIEVGYGLEGVIPDSIADGIIRKEMLPQFKLGDYSMGISSAVNVIVGIINNTTDKSIYSLDPKKSGSGVNIEFVIFFLFIVANILAQYLSKTKSWWLGGLIGAGIGLIISLFIGFLFYGIGAIIFLSIVGLIFDYFVSKIGPRGPGGHGGIWFGGGGHGSSGGFGGFGGGMSGGGGASGRW